MINLSEIKEAKAPHCLNRIIDLIVPGLDCRHLFFRENQVNVTTLLPRDLDSVGRRSVDSCQVQSLQHAIKLKRYETAAF